MPRHSHGLASVHPGNETGEKLIKDSFAVAAAAGFNVVRTYAHTTDARYPFKVNAAPVKTPWDNLPVVPVKAGDCKSHLDTIMSLLPIQIAQ